MFQIEDDGPNAVVANATADTLVLDETRDVGTEEDGDSDPAGLATVTAGFADNFAAVTDYGSDGAGSTAYTLALTGTNVASGLYALEVADTSAVGVDGDGIGQGAQIVLNQSGNTITGSVGDVNYFTISIVPSTGVVTFTQLANIWHADTGDDDDTSTLTLANANLLQVVQTVTDRDGDKDSESINLGTGVFQIEDDGPRVTSFSNIYDYNTDEPLDGMYSINVGTDAVGNAEANGLVLETLTGTTANGRPIEGVTVSWDDENDESVTYTFKFDYYAGPASTTTLEATGTVIFDKDGGTYTFDLDNPIVGQTTFSTSSPQDTFNYDTLGNNSPEIVVQQYSSDFFGVLTAASGPEGDVSGLETTTGTDNTAIEYKKGDLLFDTNTNYLNIATDTVGVGSDTVQPDDLLNFDFYASHPLIGQTEGDNPTAEVDTDTPRAYADSIGIVLDQLLTSGNPAVPKEDIAILLKLERKPDGDGPEKTTILLIANNAADYVLNDQGFYVVTVGEDDYDSANYHIYGVQIVTGTENLTGTGTSLTGHQDVTLTATGKDLADTSDNDVVKIIQIDVITSTLSNFDADLQFGGAVVDADGDSESFNFNVHLESDTSVNIGSYLTGTSGDDTLTGDLIKDDILVGGAGDDGLLGLGGNDTLTGGLGDDALDGGSGIDTASYTGAPSGVTVDLLAGAASGGDDSDSLTGIENVTGSSHADTITGDAFGNILIGGGGNDNLTGGAGNDTLVGGAGNDILAGGAGTDTFVYNLTSEGADRITDFDKSVDIDVLDLTDIFTGNETLATLVTNQNLRLVTVDADGDTQIDDTRVQYDVDGTGATAPVTLVDVTNTILTSLDDPNIKVN